MLVVLLFRARDVRKGGGGEGTTRESDLACDSDTIQHNRVKWAFCSRRLGRSILIAAGDSGVGCNSDKTFQPDWCAM